MIRRRPLCLLTAGILLLFLILVNLGADLSFCSADQRAAEVYLEKARHMTVTGKVSGHDGTLLLSDAVIRCGNRMAAVGKVQVYPESEEVYPCGWVIRAEGIMMRIPGPDNPGEFDYAKYMRIRGIRFQMINAGVTVLTRNTDRIREYMSGMRNAVNTAICSAFPEDVSGILCAMLTGERSEIDDTTRSLWQTGGIMHMLAISGLHLSLIGMGLFTALRKVRVPMVPSGIIAALFLCAYTLFTGCPVSAVRALVMFSMMIGAKLAGRTYDPLTAIACAAALILLRHPECLLYSGFQLSCWSVCIVTAFQDRNSGITALLLYLWMLPLTAALYFEVPLLSVPVNLFAVPLLPVILGGGIAGVLAGHLTSFAALPATWILRAIRAVLQAVSGMPCASVVTGAPGTVRILTFFAALSLWTAVFLKWRLYKRRFFLLILLPLLFLIITLKPGKELKLTFLSVGQGDGICVELPGDVHLLVDSGSSSAYRVGEKKVAPFLRYEGIRRLEYIVATHMDEDHINGIRELLEMVSEGTLHIGIGTLVLPYLKERDGAFREMEALALRTGVRVLTVRKGDRIRIGDAFIRVWGPDPDAETQPPDPNAQCVVMSIHYGSFDALLTGDVSGEGEAQMMRELETKRKQEGGRKGGIAWPFEVLKVAHHGSRYSTPDALLKLLQPAVSIISCGERNLYGHPHEEVLSRLDQCGTSVYRTDLDGAVTVRSDGRTYAVGTFHAGRKPGK